jgi:FAD dependent oxidoreductase
MNEPNTNAQYVLQRMAPDGTQGVFVLGCRAEQITVLSQQYRAFNLIWALFDQGLLKKGDRLGIIGGGIGGLTVAVAAMLKGCDVTLVEERQELMHLQRLNFTRLLHPNLLEWPDKISEEDSTRFPYMNWRADLANQVVEQLDSQWAALEKELRPQVRKNDPVIDMTREADGRFLLKCQNWESAPCNIVVFAVGFGVEQQSGHTYWENDSLAQSVRPQPLRRYLISGTGDGACIDVLRLKYSNFHHGHFARSIMRLTELDPFKAALVEIDRRMPATNQSEYLRDEYRKLPLPATIAESLGTLRTDTEVILTGRDPTPLSPRACILHRVAIWGLFQVGKLEYRQLNLDPSNIELRTEGAETKYMVPLPDGGKTAFDGVLMRHGPLSCLTRFPTIADGCKGITENAANDRTRRKLYPDDFYPARMPPAEAAEREPESVTSALTGKPGFEGTRPPPNISDNLMAGVEVLRPPQPTAQSVRAAAADSLTRIVNDETRAKNYPQATEAAETLEVILNQPGLPSEIWTAANRALWQYELFVRDRVEASGEKYDLGRLQDLVQRMRRGQSD